MSKHRLQDNDKLLKYQWSLYYLILIDSIWATQINVFLDICSDAYFKKKLV